MHVTQFWSGPDCWNSGLVRFEQSQKSALLIQTQIDSQETFNTSIVDRVLRFPTDIYTPSYDQRFESYDFWKSTRLLKFYSEQIRTLWEFYNPDPNSVVSLGNIHRQHRSWLSHLSGGYPCASIWLTVKKSWSFKVVGPAGNFWLNRRNELTDFSIWS
jgi:hypothetical protein